MSVDSSSYYAQEIEFMRYLPQIEQHKDKILADPQLYYFQFPSWYVGAAPIGKYEVYLGDLLILWRTSLAWFNQDPEITYLVDGWSRGRKLNRKNPSGLRIFNVAGSALSGSNSALAWDESVGELIKFTSPTVFGVLRDLELHIKLRPKALKNMMIPQNLEQLLKSLNIETT